MRIYVTKRNKKNKKTNKKQWREKQLALARTGIVY